MIYNFNLGIGWASSGVEYAQIYRARMFRNIGIDAKFVFTDMFPSENMEHMTKNIGFLDSEVIWLYTFFTDFKTAPVTYSLSDLEKTFTDLNYTKTREGKICRYVFGGSNNFYTAYMVNDHDDFVHRVEMVSNGFLIRKDYFTYGRVYSEYYAPLDNKAHLYHRRFFNVDGSVAYEEIIDDDRVMYKFKDKILCSKEEFVGYMVSQLNLTSDDVVLIDRSTDIGQSILMNCKPARVGTVVHADHFSEKDTNEDYILWNNYYEYEFNMHKHIGLQAARPEGRSAPWNPVPYRASATTSKCCVSSTVQSAQMFTDRECRRSKLVMASVVLGSPSAKRAVTFQPSFAAARAITNPSPPLLPFPQTTSRLPGCGNCFCSSA